MANENVNILINSKADLKGFKEAETAATKLNKNIKTLATTLGVAYGAKAVFDFGKAAVKAFAEDQASAVKLTNAVKNLGLAYANPQITKFIADLEKQSGIVDETLRPSFQALLTTTKDLGTSYTLMSAALDISRGSGIDLATVTQDLANGYVGITRGLKKYNTGLSTAELKSKSFAQVLAILNKEYSGASAAYLDTYAGKLDTLTVAVDNAKESIGKGLVDALIRISGGSNVQDTVKSIESITTAINALVTTVSFAVEGLVKLYKGLDWLTSFGGWTGGNGKLTKPNPKVKQGYGSGTPMSLANQVNLTKSQIKSSKILTKATTATTAELKKQAALKKDGTVFDMEQIQLIAALKGKLSDDDRHRAELQLALLNGNVTTADALTKQILMAQDATGNLYKYFQQTPDAKNPFGYLDKWILDFQTKLNALQFPVPATTGTYTPAGLAPELAAIGVTAGYGDYAGSVANQASSTLGNGLYGMQSVPSTPTSAASTTVNNYFGGNVVTDQGLVDLIMNGTQLKSLSGSPSQIGRIAGMFG
jgi:hypothetical protein